MTGRVQEGRNWMEIHWLWTGSATLHWFAGESKCDLKEANLICLSLACVLCGVFSL